MTPLPASGFLRRPWKNGLGETIVIAGDAQGVDWQDVNWSLSRTAIRQEGPFSDFAGYERWQVVIAGSGLVLETPDGEIDVRQPLRPVRYDGAVPVRARLEHGEVEVVNLIARKDRFSASMSVLEAERSSHLSLGIHILFAPVDAGRLLILGEEYRVPVGSGLRIEADQPVGVTNGGTPVLVASVVESDRRRV